MLRQRGNTYLEQSAKNAPNVLSFPFELVRDGRTLPRPVNYMLVRIVRRPALRSTRRSRRSSSSTRAPAMAPASAA